ncbi:MAG: hypothetical protein PHS54_02310 [Clostridia bacterium]|nr:hypothetical protein [Clostridia bacterium]
MKDINLESYTLNKIVLPSVSKKEKKSLHDKYKNISFNRKSKIIRAVKWSMLSLTGLVIAAVSVGEVLLPGLIAGTAKTISSKIEVMLRPEQNEITDGLIPKENKNETVKNANFLELSDTSLEALTQLSQKLRIMSSRYSTFSGKLTPSFVVIDYDDSHTLTGFKIYCDIENSRTIALSFLVNDAEDFENLLNDNNVLVTNIINKLNNDYIKTPSALPVISPRISLEGEEYYTTKIQETRKLLDWNDEIQDYNFIDVYYFEYHYFEENKMYKGSVSITKDIANSLEGFDVNNLSTLYDLFINNNNQFEKDTEIQTSINNPTLIFLSAKEMAKTQNSSNSDNLEF